MVLQINADVPSASCARFCVSKKDPNANQQGRQVEKQKASFNEESCNQKTKTGRQKKRLMKYKKYKN